VRKMSQTLEKVQEKSEVFRAKNGDLVVDVQGIVNILKKLASVADMHKIREYFGKKTGCEYEYDEYSDVEDIAKIDNVEAFEESAIDLVTCALDDYIARIAVKVQRIVMIKENTFQLLFIKAIEPLSVKISRVSEE